MLLITVTNFALIYKSSHGIARGTLYNWRVKYGGMEMIHCSCQPNES